MIKPRIIVTGATGKTGSVGNGVHEFAQFTIAPLSRGFNLDRYDRELRRPFPSEPQFAPESKLWRREHAVAEAATPAAPGSAKAGPATVSRGPKLEFQ